MNRDKSARDYHFGDRPGKIEVVPTKDCKTQEDLSNAYTPGVAVPCLDIQKNPKDALKYTAKGNLVGVISNGTAVLGLGNIGALASKPVMEGKAILFKKFADIDVFDLELNTTDKDEVVTIVKALEPTFGGINLEDIKAPECFYIEEKLKSICNIPIFHDDQHGTAIINVAALINALEIIGKKAKDIKVVFNGAGAAGIACANLYLKLGVKLENIVMCDSKGVIYKGRKERMNKYKDKFSTSRHIKTLEEAMNNADVFTGVSVADCITSKMLKSMAKDPIVFAMANPNPEITYENAMSTRDDVIMATGRSDYPNQVNNVLGFPFIFRGALDVQAKLINYEMKLAASKALAELAKKDIPENIKVAYGNKNLKFGREYIIPKPFDSRLLTCVAPAVARAAIETGVNQIDIDIDNYPSILQKRLGHINILH